MISEYEVSEILSCEFPGLKIENQSQKTRSIYQVLQRFTDLTKDAMYNGDILKIKSCFTTAEKILRVGITS